MAGFPKFTPTWRDTTYPALSPSNPSVSAANKTVLITGGGRGIGSVIASSFVTAEASNIILLGRSKSHLLAVKEKLESAPSRSKIHIFVADIADRTAIDEAFTTVRETIGPIDILVNNAAYLPKPSAVTDSSIDDWWQGFETNVLGSFLVTRAFLRTASANPVFINLSTAITHVPAMPGFSSYASSKEAFLRALDFVQLENTSLRVVNLHPGVVETDMNVKSEVTMPKSDSKFSVVSPVWLILRAYRFSF